MKIGIFSGTPLEVYGGTEIWALHVGNWLIERGYDVYFIAPKQNLSRDLERVKVNPNFKYFRVPFDVIRVGPVRAYKPRYFPKTEVKYLANLGVFPIADQRTILGGHTITPGVDLYTLKRIILILLARCGNLRMAHALTKKQAEAFVRMGFKKVYHIPNGVDCTKYRVREPSKPTVVFLGRLSLQKGIPTLIKVASLLRDVEFRIIGDGPLRNIVMKAAKKLRNITFYGFVSEEEKIEILSEASIYILPSLYEIMPLSILEAAASGLLTITSDIPHIKELDIPKILCKSYDVECFAKAISENISKININYKQKVREGVSKYCWSSILPKIEQMFVETCASGYRT